jgi:NADH-quinone oxidoreductase subunit D
MKAPIQIITLDEKCRVPEGAESPLSTQEYLVNMGPQHPSTHGVLRLVLRLDGENVREVIPVLGYVHSGVEKMAESLTYRQFIHLTDRLDYLSSLMNNWAVSMAVERAANIELNDRIQVVRTILCELQRLASHQLWWGVLGMDLGGFTPFLYGFRDREMITRILEQTTGSRLTLNYIQPGGMMHDLHPDFVPQVKEYLKYFKPKIDEYETLVGENVIVRARLCNVGVLDATTALSVGTTGPVLRASGVGYDLRKADAYGAYGKVDFDVPVGKVGDCWDRYAVRIEEMRQSVRILEQLIDNIPEGKHLVMKPNAKIRLPEGTFYSQVETARGILGAVIVSDGKDTPYRLHLRSPNFNNLWCCTVMAPGWRIADLVAVISSLDLVIPDLDR